MSNITALINATTPVAKTLFTLPLFNPALSYATILSFIATVLAVGGSIGGGGLQIAIYLICFNLDTTSTQALSRIVVASVTLVVFFHTGSYKHPHTDKPMIDYDLALLMAPAGVLGSTWGVVLNGYLSDYVILICMIVIMLLSEYLTLKRAIILRRREKKEAKELTGDVSSHGENPNPNGCFSFLFGRDKDDEDLPDEPEVSDFVGSVPESSLRTGQPLDNVKTSTPGSDDVSLDSSSKMQPKADLTKDEKSILKIQKYEARTLPPEKYAFLFLMVAGTILLLVAAGPKTISVWGITCGTALYWGVMSITFPYLLGIVLITAIVLYKLEHFKIRINFPFHETDIRWTPWSLFYFPMIDSFVVGVIAGFFGIGGGVLQAPLMLELGVIPWVASSTSQFIVLITSIAGTCQNIANGNLQWEWALWFACFNMVAAFCGKQIVDRTVRHFKLQSLIVFFLAGVIVITLICLIYSGASRIASGQGGWGIKTYCRPKNSTNSTNASLMNLTIKRMVGLDGVPLDFDLSELYE